jgi:hypothetical protein
MIDFKLNTIFITWITLRPYNFRTANSGVYFAPVVIILIYKSSVSLTLSEIFQADRVPQIEFLIYDPVQNTLDLCLCATASCLS